MNLNLFRRFFSPLHYVSILIYTKKRMGLKDIKKTSKFYLYFSKTILKLANKEYEI